MARQDSFRTEGPETTRQVADDIAENARSIMRNKGGRWPRTLSTRSSRPTGTTWAIALPSPTRRSPRDLATDFSEWVADMRLSGLLSLGKIVLHSVLLFLILRARLEPLLGLHSVVSRLARAYGGLTHWAEMGGCLGIPSPPSLHLNQTVYPPAQSMKGVRTPCV